MRAVCVLRVRVQMLCAGEVATLIQHCVVCGHLREETQTTVMGD
jgi:hypothetical protein